MPPDMSKISIHHTKIKAEEAALIAGELEKPSWESRNEGIHERVSFEDTIWGFDLAGGAYYNTPLRVTFVKPDSRAEKAGIRLGDRLLRINDIDTSTLTIEEAHKIILDSGIHLKLAVTSPEDEEDAYYYYEDPIEDVEDLEEKRRLEEEKARQREIRARVSSYWSLQWPWVSKRRIIYRESNCFMVPSKYEEKHRDQFPPQPFHKYQDDIVLDSTKNTKKKNLEEAKKNNGKNSDSNTDKNPIINELSNSDMAKQENGTTGIEISEVGDENEDEVSSETQDQSEDFVEERSPIEDQSEDFIEENSQIEESSISYDEILDDIDETENIRDVEIVSGDKNINTNEENNDSKLNDDEAQDLNSVNEESNNDNELNSKHDGIIK